MKKILGIITLGLLLNGNAYAKVKSKDITFPGKYYTKEIKVCPAIPNNKSFSNPSVFKTTLLIRSILFLIAYLFLMIGKISIITLIPVIGVIIMMLSVIVLSKRENMSEFNSSLENIGSINKIK